MTQSETRFPRTVGIFIFDDVEVLDFTRPFEVFYIALSKRKIDKSNIPKEYLSGSQLK